MRRFQVIQAINREIRVALKTYTGQDVTTELGSTLARDILGALGEALMIDSPRDAENLPEGSVIVDKYKKAYQHGDLDLWHVAGDDNGIHSPHLHFPVWLLLNPEWNNRES